MSPEIRQLNNHIDSLEELESAASRSTSCLHAAESCRLQCEAMKARPAINAAIRHFRRLKKRLLNQESKDDL